MILTDKIVYDVVRQHGGKIGMEALVSSILNLNKYSDNPFETTPWETRAYVAEMLNDSKFFVDWTGVLSVALKESNGRAEQIS